MTKIAIYEKFGTLECPQTNVKDRDPTDFAIKKNSFLGNYSRKYGNQNYLPRELPKISFQEKSTLNIKVIKKN